MIPPGIGWGRVPRSIGYALLTLCGVVAIVAPAPSVRASTMYGVAILWGVFITLGGALSGWGAITERWFGEYVGLWPLISAFTVWAVAALFAPRAGSPAAGLLLLAITFLFVARWRHVAQVKRQIERVPDRVSGG